MLTTLLTTQLTMLTSQIVQPPPFSVLQVMTTPVLCMAATERVSRVLHVLQSTRHHAFAVVDELPDGSSELIGLVSRQQLHVLLQVRCLCTTATIAFGNK